MAGYSNGPKEGGVYAEKVAEEVERSRLIPGLWRET